MQMCVDSPLHLGSPPLPPVCACVRACVRACVLSACFTRGNFDITCYCLKVTVPPAALAVIDGLYIWIYVALLEEEEIKLDI